MLFNSIEYLIIFLPLVFFIYFFLNKYKFYNAAKVFLLCASIYFYGSYKWDYVYIIITSIIFNYLISCIFKLNIKKIYKKFSIFCGVASNIIILLFFKYFNLVIEALNNYDYNHFNTMKIIIPLGISFFIIQQISYIIDCYKENVKEYNLLDYALYVCFFPQLIAGPIVRHQEMIPQFNNLKNRVINQENVFIGIFLITIGLLKKTVFADGYSTFVSYMTDNQIYYNFYISWLLGIAKLFQVYFDFSGYCDLALGSAFFFNIKLPWNFNSPFQAKNITEFWHRWNMTLIRFLQDYVYKPLGANNKGIIRTYVNILIMFTIMGIWGGFNLLSVLYGFVNGIFIVINKSWDSLILKIKNYFQQKSVYNKDYENIFIQKFIQIKNIVIAKTTAICSTFITFLCVIIATQILTVKNFNQLTMLLKSMFGINVSDSVMYIKNLDIIFMPISPISIKLNMIVIIMSIVTVFFFKNSIQLAKAYSKSDNIFYTFILAIVFIFSVLSITKGSEFIYFAF